MKRITTEEFIKRARNVHGDYYDYSVTNYTKADEEVEIICPIHGVFKQMPHQHLLGHGCARCAFEKRRRPVYGYGINDLQLSQSEPVYHAWYEMFRKCYSKAALYKGRKVGEVCDEWMLFSRFKPFYDTHHVDGWDLDKTLLDPSNMDYSPEKCCYLPKSITNLLKKHKDVNGLPYGIKHNPIKNSYTIELGTRTFEGIPTLEEAKMELKSRKESMIRRLAEKNKDNLDVRAYNTLMTYIINI